MRYLIALLCASNLYGNSIGLETWCHSEVNWPSRDYYAIETQTGTSSCAAGGASAYASYGYVRTILSAGGDYYRDWEIADAWAKFTQSVTISGRPSGTSGFVRLYGFSWTVSGGPMWGSAYDAPTYRSCLASRLT